MAHIELERRSRPVWPWVIGLIALVLLGWLAWTAFGGGLRDGEVVTPAAMEQAEREAQPAGTTADEVAGVTGGAVERFRRTCAEAPAAGAGGEAAGFELACLREMTNALAGLVLADTTGAARLDDELRELRRAVQEAERDRPTIEGEPQRFARMAQDAAGLMESLQSTRTAAGVPAEHLGRARAAADALTRAEGGAEPRRLMREYFAASAEVLRGLEAR